MGLPAPSFNWRSKEGGPQSGDDVVRVTAFHVENAPCKPAYGYRFDYKGRTAVVSGDTGYCPSIVSQSRGIDILVHEACACHLIQRAVNMNKNAGNLRLAKFLTDLSQPNVHTSPEIVMRIAKEADVKFLAYTHIVPPMRNQLIRRMWLSGIDSSGWRGKYTIGEDGMHFALPAYEGAIRMLDHVSGAQESRMADMMRRLSPLGFFILCLWLVPGGINKRSLMVLFLSAYAGRLARL